ncbi:MAG: hypothetical protein JXQ90_14275 [Cyclobacteriaceae bacterium]
MVRTFSSMLLLLIMINPGIAQRIVEIDWLRYEESFPSGILSDRSIVVINDRVNHQDQVDASHRMLTQMGVDPVMYLKYEDLKANHSVLLKYLTIFNAREIEHVILIDENKGKITFVIAKPSRDLLVDVTKPGWKAEGFSLQEALYLLALQIKRSQVERTNYLVSEIPEQGTNITLFKGRNYKTYPSQLKRFPLAIERFQRIVIDDSSKVDERIWKKISAYNQQVDKQNERLVQIFSQYPYKYKFVDHGAEADLYRLGYQYVLRSMHASGRSIKDMLKYDDDQSETWFVTNIPMPDGKRTFRSIHSDEMVYKFYLQQTVVFDANVGRYWDAERDWETALKNFIGHMIQQFTKQ